MGDISTGSRPPGPGGVARCLLLLTCTLALVGTWAHPAGAQDLPPDERFGAVEAFRDPRAAAEAGVSWERILFYWSELQPGSPDDWNSHHVPNEWLDLAASGGRQVVGLLKHTPQWATDGPVGCGVPRGLDLPLDDPGNLWAAFIRRTVQMYAGRIDHWIVWNEPDITPETYGGEWCGTVQEYYQLLKVAYLAAHQVNPNVTIHLAGLTYWHDPQYLRRFLTVATRDPSGAEHGYYFDVVSLHIYFRTETVPDLIRIARAALRDYGLHKPIWLNETNAPPNSDPQWQMPAANYEISLEEQASFLLQSFALALSAGAERVAVYKWLDNDLLPGFEPFGIIRPDFSKRPAYDAFRLIRRHYAGVLSATEDRQRQYILVTIERGPQTTRVVWARTQNGTTVSLPALAPEARLIQQTAEEQVIQPADGQYVLTLPGARCADKRGCIIGGPTFLLIEETDGPPLPTPEISATIELTVTADITAITTVASPLETPTPSLTPTETATPSPTPSATPSPSPTPSRTPTVTHTPTPTLTPSPVATQTPTESPAPPPVRPAGMRPGALSIVIGLAGVALVAGAVTFMVRQRTHARREAGGP